MARRLLADRARIFEKNYCFSELFLQNLFSKRIFCATIDTPNNTEVSLWHTRLQTIASLAVRAQMSALLRPSAKRMASTLSMLKSALIAVLAQMLAPSRLPRLSNSVIDKHNKDWSCKAPFFVNANYFLY
jgi:hypothetical protein